MATSASKTVWQNSVGEPVHPGSAIALLSNDRYSVLATAAGTGYATWQDLDVTRWREDRTRDCWGQFCYVRDLSGNDLWSIGRQPRPRPGHVYQHAFFGDRAEFRCHAGDIEILWKICVATDVDAEVRMLSVTNHGTGERILELTSYAEVCLNNRRADMAHPAFAKLFVETRFDEATGALFARRRPRASGEKATWAVHVSSSDLPQPQELQYETDRLRFLGRGRTTASPAIFDEGAPLSGTTGPVLDPVFCLRRVVRLSPGGEARLAFVTGAADDQSTVDGIARRYANIDAAERAFLAASERYETELRTLGLKPDEVSLFNRLAGSVLFANPAMRQATALPTERLDRAALWAQGISGDLPIALVRTNGDRDHTLVRQVTTGYDFARRRGLRFDLVLLEEGGAASVRRLTGKLRSGPYGEMISKPGGIFVLSTEGDHLATIVAAARVVLLGSGGDLGEQLKRPFPTLPPLPSTLTARPNKQPAAPPPEPAEKLLYWNELGGFTSDGREYVVLVDAAKPRAPALPPAPWTNVIANPEFGCLTTEAGLGYTWSQNSQMNRLTPWSNDPIADMPGEVLYLRDEETGDIWTPTPLPIGPGAAVTVRHGQGYSRYIGHSRHLNQELTISVPLNDPVKIIRLRLTNDDVRARHVTATYFAEWVLGTHREDAATRIVCSRDTRSGAIVARNPWGGDFAGKLAFAAASEPPRSATSDRTEFLGNYGSVCQPAAMLRTDLAERFGPMLDPCAALMVDISLSPGESREVVFVLGEAIDLGEVHRLVHEHADPERAVSSLSAVSRQWDDILNSIQVSTPDPGLDLMMNRWLLYQVLACRVWARTSNYQSGGAYGFRDQLQDVMALVYSRPSETRSHILRSAARQFEEGDVQHWWHPPSGIGVRTRITDDLYFLPLVVHHYVSTTGDVQLLDEMVPFITSPVLKDGQEEDFNQPATSEQFGSVYEHCVRALEHGYRLGRHGLPLMGTGDWNDGMNKVGAEGKGESVWNGWFFLTVLKSFAEISSSRGDQNRTAWCRDRVEALRKAIEANAWDGGWYRRAYFDDGTPLGSSLNDECQIDALPQAWAVISGEADAKRAAQAMRAVHERLVLPADKMIKLFDPPFDKGVLQPGYIKGYVPGIRENGGQYTHAATWVVWATALQGDGDLALKLWNLINPICHGATKDQIERYKVEPYVVCADVYGAAPHTGRGGWAWYTGSASWFYRVALEAILGFHRQGAFLRFAPCVPTGWPAYEITYRHGSATYRIRFDNSKGIGRGVYSVTLDGEPVPNASVPLVEDGRLHDVHVGIG
ncbi:glycosyl transferase [Rhizobium sp. Root1203]|uniref:GH36-type glycosyl hydrolase domain-containing protein n=1 Tax=Rhizobium sp. Root1203 TaxID=1736427 RepID=UPI00070B5C7B|nr:glycosyl transferase [Rhizobium sp. Root1203]KQV32700.1 glycosyl transferase [Rhizobium sp. Root1203]